MIWAYVENGVVKDRVRVDPFTVFSAEYAGRFIQAPDDVDPGWLYNGVNFTALPAPVIPEIVTPPTPTKDELLAQLLAIQAQIEALK
jgi:hypothetical protein